MVKNNLLPGMEAHTCNAITWKMEARGSGSQRIPGHYGLLESLPQKQANKQNELNQTNLDDNCGLTAY